MLLTHNTVSKAKRFLSLFALQLCNPSSIGQSRKTNRKLAPNTAGCFPSDRIDARLCAFISTDCNISRSFFPLTPNSQSDGFLRSREPTSHVSSHLPMAVFALPFRFSLEWIWQAELSGSLNGSLNGSLSAVFFRIAASD